MNKKGFTLIELLAVMILIAIIIAIVFPSISIVVNQSKKTIKDVQINRILDATYDYTLRNVELLPKSGETTYLTLNELKKERLIDADIKDSITKKNFNEDLVISIKNVGAKYNNNNNNNSKSKGNYLYTVEVDFMKTEEFKNKKPSISFEGYDDSDIIINLNLGDEYVLPPYSSASYSGEDLTARVIKNVIHNSQNCDDINTDSAGIYYINYSVVDLNGFSNYATISIVVSDNEKPILEIPNNITISSDVTKYDLMEGVNCTDNSEVCDINLNGSINFGVSGKYIIEYIASDPSGNTTILKRVITVE